MDIKLAMYLGLLELEEGKMLEPGIYKLPNITLIIEEMRIADDKYQLFPIEIQAAGQHRRAVYYEAKGSYYKWISRILATVIKRFLP